MYWHSKDGIWFSFAQSRYRARQALTRLCLSLCAAATVRGLSSASLALTGACGNTGAARNKTIAKDEVMIFIVSHQFRPWGLNSVRPFCVSNPLKESLGTEQGTGEFH